MGLDVYLYEILDPKVNQGYLATAIKEHEELVEKFYEEEYNTFPEGEERDRRAQAVELADPEEGVLSQGVCFPSVKYPDHLFKVGYWRSSYNDGGINSVLERMGCETLYDVIPEADNQYQVFPDWEGALRRAQNLLGHYVVRKEKTRGFDILKIHSWFPSEGGAGDSLATFLQQLEQYEDRLKADEASGKAHPWDFSSYSSRDGSFFLKGVQVYGFMPKTNGDMHVVVKKDPPEGGDFYQQALEIVVETCQYAVDNGPERFYLHWSG